MIYDLIVIGGGPAGYLAAERAGHAGLSVAIIEERELGGVCLNEGCIPTKTLLYSAKTYENALQGDKYGITATGVEFDFGKMMARKNTVVRKLVAGVEAQMRAGKVAVFSARGEITGKSPEGYTVKAGEENLTGKNILIATGSAPAMPPSRG